MIGSLEDNEGSRKVERTEPPKKMEAEGSR